MQGILGLFRGVTGFALCALLLSACATAPVEEPVPMPEAIVESEPEPPPEIPIIPPLPDPPVEPIELPDPPSVAIALTSRQPAYDDVARELGELLDNYTIYDLSDKSQPPITAFRMINDSDARVVVAIGLRAARSSVAMSEFPVVFSQVFNHQEHALLGESTRGISALAPLDAYLAAWKDLDPAITRVGAIIGTGHDELIRQAHEAADQHGIQLTVRIVESDQEALYHFRRMIRNIDGFWLFPDNRVLSTRSLREFLSRANQRKVPVAVSNEAMLSMGATISISTVASDIAATIVDVIRNIEAGRIEKVPELSRLSEVRIVVNDALVNRSLPDEAPAPERTARE